MADIGQDFSSPEAGDYGLIPGGNPSKTRAALQSILDAGGDVTFTRPGIYEIDDALRIGDDTHLRIGKGVTLVATSKSGLTGKPLLITEAYSRRSQAVTVTCTWSSGTSMNVLWTAHGLAVGDCIWIQGATLSVYNTIARVLAVVDANNVTVDLQYVPSGAVSGTTTALKCNKNIRVQIDGMLDLNYPKQVSGAGLDAVGVHLCLVDGLVVDSLNIKNVEKWVMQTSALRNASVRNVYIDGTNSDGPKIIGPAINVHYDGIGGTCNDDVFSMQARVPAAFASQIWTNGDIVNCSVQNVNGRTGGFGQVSLYPTNTERMLGIKVENIAGVSVGGQGVKVQAEHSASDVIDSLSIDNVTTTCVQGVRVGRTAANGAIVQSLEVRNLNPQCQTTSAAPFLIDAGCAVWDGNIHFALDDTNVYGTAVQYAAISNGTHRRLKFSGIINGGGSARGIQFSTTALGDYAEISLEMRTGDQVCNNAATGAIGTIAFKGCDTTTATVMQPAQSCTLVFEGNRFHNASNGLIRCTGTPTLTVRSAGNNVLTGTSAWYVVPSGTPVTSFYGWDVAIDPIAAVGITTTAGQYCLSTQAGVEGGPSVRTPAGWVALGTGASGVNTVIT